MDGADGLVVVMLILLIVGVSGALGWWLGSDAAKRQFASRHFASVDADWSRQLDQASQDTATLVAKLTADLDAQQKALSAAENAWCQAAAEAAVQQATINELRESLSLTALHDRDLAALRARIEELEGFPGKLADVERRLAQGAIQESHLQATLHSKDEELASLAGQIRQQWATAIHAKDQEIGSLWARIRELEPLAGHLKDWELHHHTTIQAKDEEITSLIERLKDFERLSARLAELENGLPDREGADDLKRIYGIGPVLEARLNALGLFRFEQIGRWGDDEIEAFQAQLPEFPGRIRREAWVKSARDEYLRKYRHPLG